MSNIAIIPARGGSTRIPLKNCLDFHGKPIIQYSILTAQRSGLFDVIVVSTDHPKIAEAAHQVGAVVMWRPANLCQNEVGTQQVTAYVLEMFEGRQPDLACCIYPTAPMMTDTDLRAGLAAIEECRPAPDYAMSVGDNPLQDAGQWYWGRPGAFISNRPLIGARTVMVRIPENRVCDINTPEDWARAYDMYSLLTMHKDVAP